MTTLIRLDNVSFSYKGSTQERPVVESMTLEVEKGEFLAVVGPSGSGKSTLLALMAGLKAPQQGRVLFEGKDLAEFTEKQHAAYLNCEVGMIYQFFNLIPDMSALGNVTMPALIGGAQRKAASEKALQLLREVGLDKKAKARAAKLSGGQQQRAAIARAFMNDPKLILADEPTGNLDRAATETVMEVLCRERQRRGTALVVVTHDKEVAAMADSILEL